MRIKFAPGNGSRPFEPLVSCLSNTIRALLAPPQQGIVVDLDPQLLSRADLIPTATGDLSATLNAHGLYNAFQFVLRLSPVVHQKLSELPPMSIVSSGKIDFAGVQAFSIYLHETIHWWQHIGSTHGLMRSLSYPTQVHSNYSHLKQLISKIGFKKPVRELARKLPRPGGIGTERDLANIIVNNHFDFDAFRRLTFNRSAARSAIEDPYFDCAGHTYEITYCNNIVVLATTVDPDFRVLHHPKEWEGPFDALRQSKEDGFYYGSSIGLYALGAQEILEGQACVNQLQYLAFGSGGSLSWDNFRALGMLHGVYTKAFETFLELAELEWPPTLEHPIVGLFLLICDMAINPGAGFPFPLTYFATFITDIDPGARFYMLCRLVRLKCPEVITAIRNYTRSEYERVSEQLASALIVESPLAIASICRRWAQDDGPLANLMKEYRSFDYGPGNLPVRVLFSHFLAFMEDKFEAPEFFCWPGAWMAGTRVSEHARILFDRHQAPFIDKQDDDGIFPRLYPNRDDKFVEDTFDSFYAFNVTYDLTNQWITEYGAFTYDYQWLTSSTQEERKNFADRHFFQIYGVYPDEVELL
jgi:hypothetical protein